MIFNVSSGGTASAGSWKFTTATAKPDAVAKMTMLAILASAPPKITVADEHPASPAAGDVWFHIINPDDDRVFSDGSVPIRMVGAYSWVAATEAATAATTITGGTVTVAAATFGGKVGGRGGTHVFSFNGTTWSLNGATVTLSEYGITITAGTPANGNTITVVYVSGWTLLTAYYSYLGVWHDMPSLPPVGTSLENCSWDQIGRIAASGRAAQYFAVGDKKSVTLTTAEVVTMRIIGFCHDDLPSAGGGKAPITFDVENCLATTQKINPTDTNVGGYSGCAFYATLTNTIFNTLPEDLRSVIKQVSKKTSAGNQSATIVTTAEKIFLLSEVEVHGAITYAKTGEGTQYALFTSGGSKVKKVGAAASAWWLRSPYASGATYFCTVNSGGAAYYAYASDSLGVAFGLCV